MQSESHSNECDKIKSMKEGKIMKTGKKVLIGVGAVVVLAIAVVGGYWFSLPVGQRNMILFMAGSSESYDNYEVRQVVERNDEDLVSSFDVYEASSEEGDADVNIRTVTEMVLNEDSGMLKNGMVDTLGVEGYTGWTILADEMSGDDGSYPFATSPLSYYTAGLASNLHKQVLDAADVLNVDIDSVTVEVLNTFRWNEMSSVDGQGFLDESTTNIMIDSDASEEEIQAVIELALKGWAPGNSLAGETSVEPHLIVDGDNFDTYNASPATTNSDVSTVDGLQLSSVTEEVVLPTFLELTEVEEQSILEMMSGMDIMEFEIYAISESAPTDERPYLNRIYAVSPSGETWELYADEFMFEGDEPVAPTSLEYFTLGTSLCLTSQTTLVSAMMDLDVVDYRVEHMFEYSLENVGTEDMSGGIDLIHTYIIIEANEDQETLDEFMSRALSLCFAGEGLVNETDMEINTYINGDLVE